MPSLARGIFAEWLDTAFLLAAVVGSVHGSEARGRERRARASV
jgi:hypothetical protein